MAAIDLENVVTDEEMTSFVKGLFKGDKLDPTKLDLSMPTVDTAKVDGVDFATNAEVKDFISGLFNK